MASSTGKGVCTTKWNGPVTCLIFNSLVNGERNVDKNWNGPVRCLIYYYEEIEKTVEKIKLKPSRIFVP